MAVKTYTEQLESVQAAIEAIEGGAQAYTIQTAAGARTVTRATIFRLYEREKELRRLVARESKGGGARVRYGTPV